MSTVISVENLSKCYQLGVINTGTFYGDLERWWAKLRGKPDPYLKIGETDHGNRQGETIWALKDINLQVQQGEALGIIGRNGAGKSTLLKILSRVAAPTNGEIKVKGRIASLLEVGTGFHPELTGRENVYINGAILGMNRAEVKRKFDEIVDFSGVERFIDTPVKRYSSGMYVRLAFAVAAHLDTDILIVDEVLAVGDAQFQKKCLGKMGDLAHEGRTILFVSHSMDAIRRFCSRAILLEIGRIQEDGLVDDVITHYYGANESSTVTPEIELPESGVVIAGHDHDQGLGSQPSGRGNRMRILNMDGQLQTQFKLGEPWKIQLEFEIFRPLEHCIAAIALVTVERVAITTFWSKAKDLLPGKYFVEFHIELPLAACDLQFVVGLSNFERAFYYHEELGKISILDMAKDSEQPFRARGSGFLLSEPQSEIESLE